MRMQAKAKKLDYILPVNYNKKASFLYLRSKLKLVAGDHYLEVKENKFGTNLRVKEMLAVLVALVLLFLNHLNCQDREQGLQIVVVNLTVPNRARADITHIF